MAPRIVTLALALLLASPLAGAVVSPVDDDAGTGRDAPDAPDPSFVVATNVVHSAFAVVLVDLADTYGFEGVAGDRVSLHARGTLGCYTLFDPSLAERGTYGCSYGEAMELPAPEFTLDATGTWYVQFAQLVAGPYRFVIAQNAPAPDLALTAPLTGDEALMPGADPTCGTGAPVTATAGAGDAAHPSLVYAALKTGFRAVVAWETPDAVAASLVASVEGGAPVTLTETSARLQHVFVLDGLPVGRALCFTPEGGAPHALRLVNAMNAHDGVAYSLNLLVLANEQPDRATLEAGLDDFATSLWDATEGHVRAGRIVAVFGDYERHNSGWATCYVGSAATGNRPLCENVYDVIFTYDGSAGGAAQTYKDAIQDPARAIWMDQEFQAPVFGVSDDVGNVLLHEMGHYAFGMLDLYGNLAGTDADCWDPARGLSVMGGNRAATEFDDEVNRCPNEAIIVDYVPSYTLLRERFPLVPDRAGVIDAGPYGDGGAYARHSFVVAPQASDAVDLDLQDDAGSGRDAPDGRDGAPRIEPGIVYTGIGLGAFADLGDAYVFHGDAGQTFEGWSDGNVGCYTLFAPDETELGTACAYGGAPINTGPLVVTLPATGDYRFRVAQLAPAQYRFAFGLDAPAPDVRLLLVSQDDAGSGRDAPDGREDAPRVAPGVVHSATSLGPILDATDAFVFHAQAGQVVEVWADGGVGCLDVVGPDGVSLAGTCMIPGALPARAVVTLQASGDHLLSLNFVSPAQYRFAFGLDAPAPPVPPLMG